MKLKTGDRLMYEGEMLTVVEHIHKMYILTDSEGEEHPNGPFTKAELKECPVL